MIETDWTVFTGGPNSGKTTATKYFAFLGYPVVPEAARFLIDMGRAGGKTTEEIRGNEADFQRNVLEKKIEVENIVPTDRITIFDRGMPDSIAYYRISGLDETPAREACIKKYKNVFLFDQLPFRKDYARIENEETARKIHRLIEFSYGELGYETVRVPVMPVEERVGFIASKIKSPGYKIRKF